MVNTLIVRDLTDAVAEEVIKACDNFPPFRSPHEGYAIILEEVEELWQAIMNNKTSTKEERRKEALQIAAMATRYLLDCDL